MHSVDTRKLPNTDYLPGTWLELFRSPAADKGIMQKCSISFGFPVCTAVVEPLAFKCMSDLHHDGPNLPLRYLRVSTTNPIPHHLPYLQTHDVNLTSYQPTSSPNTFSSRQPDTTPAPKLADILTATIVPSSQNKALCTPSSRDASRIQIASPLSHTVLLSGTDLLVRDSGWESFERRGGGIGRHGTRREDRPRRTRRAS